MRSAHTMLSAFTLVAGALAGCNGAPSGDPTGQSQARLVVSEAGQDSATLHVTAVDDATAATVVDQTITVEAGSAKVVSLSLEASGYTFAVEVLGAGDAKIGGGSAHVDLQEGVTTQIALAAQIDAGGSAQVQIGADAAPVIQGVSASLQGDGTVQIHVDASDADGGALTFFWSGAGFPSAVQCSSTMSIPQAAVTASSVVHVVVQDAQGAASSADIALASVGGDVQAAMSAGASTASCLDAQAQCNAACGATVVLGSVTSADASCLAACGLSFAQCANTSTP